ncbi:MAG: ABC transporter ATP-binding protein [Bacilli bacterium]|nr:ABC transporter ATP-binding protein [Bacilli bacterium]
MIKNLKEFKPLINLLKEEKKKFIFFCILLFAIEASSVFYGYLNGSAVEEITKLHLEKSLIFLGIYFVYELIYDCLYILAENGLVKLESKLTRKIGYEAYSKALNLPAYAYEKMSSGEIINRITTDSDALSFTFRKLIEAVGSIVAAIILLVYIFFNSWIVALELIVCMGILFLIMKYYNPKMKESHAARKKEQDKFTSLVTESVRGIREIKTLGIRHNLLTEMKDIIELLYKKSVYEMDLYCKFNVFAKILRVVMEISVFVTCAILLYKGEVSLTFFVAMSYYIYRYMYMIDNLSDLNQTYQKVVVALKRINELVLNRKFEDEKYGNVSLRKVKGVIEFKNVYFGYPDEKNILKNFNLKLEPNKKIAIVGRSGQGKSTLFNLLTRVFDVNKGSITLDGVDIKDLDEKTLRKNISIIRQEPFIFNRTIKNNFKVVNNKIKLDEIKEYNKKAFLDDYINSLPDKYDTLLGEGGVNLSGGQKQRLSIARTLTKDTKVILFDEATSALDNNSQEYIKKTINNLVKDHTVVIVAHRLSTIIDADVIYVVDGGKIVGEGTHEDLLKTNKIYRNLYETESLNS